MGKHLALSLTLLGVLLGCGPERPEDRVRKAFEACRKAVEAGDAATATAPLDPAFRGPEGMDKATTQLVLMGILKEGKAGVTVVRNEVTIRGKEAFQDVDLILTSRGGGLLPKDASHRTFQLRWREEAGKWKLVEAQSPQSLDGR